MAALTLTPTSYSIKASISGMDPEHDRKRIFDWYLDGVFNSTVVSDPRISSIEHEIKYVYFASEHTVKVDIFDDDHETLFTTLTGSTTTLSPTFAEWDWTSSNGDASAEETMAAYTALTTKGQTATMTHDVWNDLMSYIEETREKTGQRLVNSTPTTLEQYDPLLASIMNAAVANVAYPRWTWRDSPNDYDQDGGRISYLGRLEFIRMDIVFGRYIVEIAKNLNVMRRIYSGTQSTRSINTNLSPHLSVSARAFARQSRSLICSPSARLAVSSFAGRVASRRLTATMASQFSLQKKILTPCLCLYFTAGASSRMQIPGSLLRAKSSFPLSASLLGSSLGFYADENIARSLPFSAVVYFDLDSTAVVARVPPMGISVTDSAMLNVYSDLETGLPRFVNAELSARVNYLATFTLLNTIDLGAIVSNQLDISASADSEEPVVWEYPILDTDGLFVRQVHLVYQNTQNAHIQIDWYNERETGTNMAIGLETSAIPFLSHGWVFPERIPNGSRILHVYQSLSVTQTAQEIEVT